jgi:hypothetical protein
MRALATGLVGVAALSFVAGVAAVLLLHGELMNIPAESFSRGANNLALIAIALLLLDKGQPPKA